MYRNPSVFMVNSFQKSAANMKTTNTEALVLWEKKGNVSKPLPNLISNQINHDKVCNNNFIIH